MTITLLSGREVDPANILFDSDTYAFTLKNEEGTFTDITDDLSRVDKRSLVKDFDDSKEDIRISNARGVGLSGKVFNESDSPTTTMGVVAQSAGKSGNLFDLNGIIDGILDGLKGVASAVGNALQNFASSAGTSAGQSAVPVLALLIVAGFAGYYLLKKK